MVGALESLGGQRPRPLSRVADELVRRGRLSGDPAALVPTLAAAARADDAKREARQHRPRFRLHGDEVGLLEWALPPEAARVEREVEQAARKQRDFVRRAFIRRLSELPTAAFMELLATWLNVVGVTALRGIRRPGSSGGELHLAGLLKQGPLETPLAIVIVRDGGSIGREKVVEIRGGLHHYGSASAAWLITLGQVLSGAREEASAAGAVPCALFDGQELARSMEEARVGLRTYVVPVVGLDIDLLDSLRGPGARPVQQPQQP
ncbi:MAG: restriction endonuclease, partial [Polyangiaceae bacterium]|nr:restriction endonuclease [Polyangiaceae bacterium]